MRKAGNCYIPKSFYNGSVTLRALFMGLRGAGYSPIAARSLLQDLIRDSHIRTEPALPAPAEARLLVDLSLVVDTHKETHWAEDIRVNFDARAGRPPPLRQRPGVDDSYDWTAARTYMHNLHLFYIAAHGEVPPDAWWVGELRVYFSDTGGEVPHDTTLRRYARQWKTKMAGREATPFEQLPPLGQIERLIQKLPVQARRTVRAMLDAAEPPLLSDDFIERLVPMLSAEQRRKLRALLDAAE